MNLKLIIAIIVRYCSVMQLPISMASVMYVVLFRFIFSIVRYMLCDISRLIKMIYIYIYVVIYSYFNLNEIK